MMFSKRIINTFILLGVFLFTLFLYRNSIPQIDPTPLTSYASSLTSSPSSSSDRVATSALDTSSVETLVSYDKSSPPSIGCEDIVLQNQQILIGSYATLLRGIRYANLFGYLETENKGDAAIWAAQQMIMANMGIEPMEVCRYPETERGCDIKRYRDALEQHRPYSAILIAGGGNFNDFYWQDQPARIKMVGMFHDFPIRSFPQSIHMTNPGKINETIETYVKHKDLQLAARDAPSFQWLKENFGGTGVQHVLTPDVAFMWGNRTDIRVNTPRKYDIVLLYRDDWEISAPSDIIPKGEGVLDLGDGVGEVTYRKVDWKFTQTPDINGKSSKDKNGKETVTGYVEKGRNQRAWAKAMAGFEMLAEGSLVITDRLHGHIMSTILGIPHILMDSKLKKNLNYHNTWTADCECTRVADNIEEAKAIAKLFFEKNPKLPPRKLSEGYFQS